MDNSRYIRRDLVEWHKRAYWPDNYESPMAAEMRAGEEENLTAEERLVMADEALVELEVVGVWMDMAKREYGLD